MVEIDLVDKVVTIGSVREGISIGCDWVFKVLLTKRGASEDRGVVDISLASLSITLLIPSCIAIKSICFKQARL